MSETPPRRFSLKPRAIIRVMCDILGRIYALALMLVVCYAGYLAASYLYSFILEPATAPIALVAPPARIDVAALRDLGVQPLGIRAPLAHFHGVGRRLQADAQNGCTISGCHEPMPHGTKMKVPAFANFHVGFLACQSCHTDVTERPGKFVWMDLKTHEVHDVPAAIRLARLLDDEAGDIRKQPAQVQSAIVSLVRRVLELRAQDKVLAELLVQLETTELGSPIWRTNIERLAAELPRYTGGGYGAALIPEAQLKTDRNTNRELRRLAGAYFAAADDSPQRKILDARIHASIVKRPGACAGCHVESPGLLDFSAVGYSPDRGKVLGDLRLARILDRIREGGEFRLPLLIGGANVK